MSKSTQRDLDRAGAYCRSGDTDIAARILAIAHRSALSMTDKRSIENEIAAQGIGHLFCRDAQSGCLLAVQS